MSWQQSLDDLKRRAAGKVQPVLSEEDARDPEKVRDWLQKANSRVICGWDLLLTRTRQEDDSIHWHLSAKLYPNGRSSTEDDWKFIGQAAAHLGAPQDPAVVPDDPNRPIHWHWLES